MGLRLSRPLTPLGHPLFSVLADCWVMDVNKGPRELPIVPNQPIPNPKPSTPRRHSAQVRGSSEQPGRSAPLASAMSWSESSRRCRSARLLFLVGATPCMAQPGRRRQWTSTSCSGDASPAVAEAPRRQVARAIHQGLLPGYVTVEESFLRSCVGGCGKARSSPMHHGLPLPLEIRHAELPWTSRKTRSYAPRANECCSYPGVDEESTRMLVGRRPISPTSGPLTGAIRCRCGIPHSSTPDITPHSGLPRWCYARPL